MKLRNSLLLLILATLFSCQYQSTQSKLKTGTWLGAIMVDPQNDQNIVPFNMKITNTDGKYVVTITNDNEKIVIDEIDFYSDSVTLYLPVFQNKIVGRLTGDSIVGEFVKATYSMPFYAVFGEEKRFPEAIETPLYDISGKWKIIENPGQESETMMIGQFKQDGSKLTGTFLTVLGDYRYLEGNVSGNKMMLSTFDGSHSIVFKAEISSETELSNGIFRGSPSWKSDWIATKDENAELPDPGNLTFVKDGYKGLEFSFPDSDGNLVSLSDEKFKNKAVIVQILGTWCPNCMDETKYLASLYDEYKEQGLEVIALCFELYDDERAITAIKRFKKHNKANYTFLLAGNASKKDASKKLPMLNKIISYPTAIFIDKNKGVRKIHTGFSGPGTGEHFDKLSKEFVTTIETLLEEK